MLFAILLRDKEDWDCLRGLERADISLRELVINEGIDFFLLIGGQRDEVTLPWSEAILKLNSMVPWLASRHVFRCGFRKDV